MLADALRHTVADLVESAELICSGSRVRARINLKVDGEYVYNADAVAFPTDAGARVAGMRFFDAEGRVRHEVTFPEQRFTRAGRMVFPATTIRFRLTTEV